MEVILGSNTFDLYPERFNQVKNGTKKATLRKGHVSCKTGSATIENSSTKESMKINITKVQVCKLSDITPEMIKALNYSTYEEAKKTMSTLYPDLEESSLVTYIEFN